MVKPHTAAAACIVIAAVMVGGAHAERRDQTTRVAIWRSVGGNAYGGSGTVVSSGFVSHRREVDIAPGGEARFPGVAAALDAATVEVRSITDPDGTRVVEQRFVANLANPEALLNRQVGKAVTVVLARGEVKGTLRAVSIDALVIETADGGMEIVRRGEHVVGVELGAAAFDHEPVLEWKLAARKPGKQTLDVSYRTFGLSWAPEYTAVIDGDQVDFTAWATVRNDTGVELGGAELTLVSETTSPATSGFVGATPVPPVTFKVARPVDLASLAAMQVELMPKLVGAKARRVTVFEAMLDQSQSFPNQDCHGYTPPSSAVRSEAMIELDARGPRLPEGQVRVFGRAAGGGLVVIGEAPLHVNATTGALRVRAGASPEIVGERRTLDCRIDPGGRALRERVELELENKGKAPVEVVVREYLYRWSNWRIDAEDVKGVRAGPTAQEWRVKLPGGGKKTFSYAVSYAW